MNKYEIAKMIDHTLLAPEAGEKKIAALCAEAKKYGFASVCVNPCHVKLCSELLKDSDVNVCTVIGFPLGATPSSVKAFEAFDAVSGGAEEIDMVINVGNARDHKFEAVENDIEAVVNAVKKLKTKRGKKPLVKVILETCFLADEEIVECCLASKKAGADFVKTSTGFAVPKASDGSALPNGASVHHVELMRKTVGSDMGVKASGGIRSAQTALQMVNAGASRIGTSSGVVIVESWQE